MSLLRSDEEPVWVIEKRTGEVIEARVDNNGIVRETDSPAAYSDGAYELLIDEA